MQAICLDRLPPFIDGRDFTQQEGFVAYAMDLVRFQKDAERLVRHLLGKTIVVRTLADAAAHGRPEPAELPLRHARAASCSTRDGPVPARARRAARAGLISRKSELREIDAQIDEVDERIAT